MRRPSRRRRPPSGGGGLPGRARVLEQNDDEDHERDDQHRQHFPPTGQAVKILGDDRRLGPRESDGGEERVGGRRISRASKLNSGVVTTQ